ncbi:hypothetical protein GCM10007940_45230 [Portibacter lacus]|uniref:Uncharacterized protein n=1 Tax=Portibacter lacus TaxID=1099794 RepID=A0AA37STK5_9BACT|nr:hypothetical protein GCM10007940_45230 [Portibacter lacus]
MDKSYETITKDPLYTAYYNAFIESSNHALKFDIIEIGNNLDACDLNNNGGSICDPLPDCDIGKETVQWLEVSCKVFTATNAVKEKYVLTNKEFGDILSKYIKENYEVI